MSGAVLLSKGYPADFRWEHADLWRQLQKDIQGRPTHAPVRFKKVKARATRKHIQEGVITEGEAAGNDKADRLADEGRAINGNLEQEWADAAYRVKAQALILRTSAAILDERHKARSALQGKAEEEPEAAVWERPLVAPTPFFRRIPANVDWQAVEHQFPGGAPALKEMADYFTALQWVPSDVRGIPGHMD
jgi:hypothetical protein